jgi:hypothetical protein
MIVDFIWIAKKAISVGMLFQPVLKRTSIFKTLIEAIYLLILPAIFSVGI